MKWNESGLMLICNTFKEAFILEDKDFYNKIY